MTSPPARGDGEADEQDDEPSFFADQLAEACEPWRLPEVDVEFEDRAGPYTLRLAVVLEVPDDQQVAELDQCGGALDELEVLAGDDDAFEDLLDALDALGWSPAGAADAALAAFHLDRPPEPGWLELVEMLNVYGRAIEYDLWERGHDLAAYFRGERPWDHLVRVTERLPPGCQYRAAMADDDELAARIAEVHGPPSKRRKRNRPALAGWTTEVSYLHQIANGLGRVQWAVFAAQAEKGKRGSVPKGAKGPETADDRYERMDAAREHTEIVDQVLVRRGGSKARGGRAWVPGDPGGPKAEAVRGAVRLDPPDTT